jgi:hypothetical protein
VTEPNCYWIWQVFDTDGEWGVIAAELPGAGLVPLSTRQHDIADGLFRQIAERHRELHPALPVRLARYDFAYALETLP